ncbi:hypothetical protein [Streptomyces panaciradicis]|uniref:hypothetical protein n=1 Tax=Streptomyces panaciradicis TaxID=1470261 RepID=UPI00201D21F1|nr:hypothetical protein [Streptomyces panaciradicis]MCL6669604.1 hypothetical protein [Streptomyces panaciradicis]
MSRDEETDDPGAVDENSAPRRPVDMSKREPFEEAPGAPQPLSVVIAADGSAAIDGAPVPVEGGAVDAAILDALHHRATERGFPVTAAISDPAVEQVTFVEVSPDGSSRLVEPPEPAEDGSEPTPWPEGPGFGGPVFEDPGSEGPGVAGPGVVGLGASGPGVSGPGMAPPSGPTPPPTGSSKDDADFEQALADVLDDLDDAPYAPQRPSGTRPATGPLLRRQKPAAGTASRQSDDEFRASGLLHRPLVVGPVALGVAALVVVPLVLLGSGGSGGGENKAAGASDELTKGPSSHGPSATPTPTVSVSPSLLSPSPSASPSGKGKRGGKGKKHTDGATGVTTTVTVRPPAATATVTARPAADTAASAVNRLARNDPGRHICYRAYVSGQGWQKPVCDGTVAGTTGQNRSIKALNIAVRGTGGTAANAFVHKPGSTDGKGVWMPHWTANTADGKDIYIGHAKKSAPNMLGFAINIGSGGQVCQAARVHNSDWGQWGCVGPRPEYVFGGTLTNDVYLEAVKFTV